MNYLKIQINLILISYLWVLQTIQNMKHKQLANKIISIAELRKDVVAFVSPYRGAFLNDSAVGQGTINSSADITNNLIGYYAPITSSTFAYSIVDTNICLIDSQILSDMYH